MRILTRIKKNDQLLSTKHHLIGLLFDTRDDLQSLIEALQEVQKQNKDYYTIMMPKWVNKPELDSFKESCYDHQARIREWDKEKIKDLDE